MYDFSNESRWVRFWHEPLRAERLAAVRIFICLALLGDMLLQYIPHFADFFGPGGVAYEGLHDEWLLQQWRLTILFFSTDNLAVVGSVFAVWMAATVCLLVGYRTRLMNVVVWFLTICFINRNPIIKNGGDDVLCVTLFLLMMMPSGKAFSIDRLLWKRRAERKGERLPADWSTPHVPAWGVRVLQIQLCMIYLTTGLAKLRGVNLGAIETYFGDGWPEDLDFFGRVDYFFQFLGDFFNGTWYNGTSIYYVLNDVTMARVAWPENPLPVWAAVALSYFSVGWEILFTPLIFFRWTRRWMLWLGVLFHIGIYMMIEVGWFSFYTLSLYGAWIGGEFWDRRFRKSAVLPTPGKEPVHEKPVEPVPPPAPAVPVG